MQSVSRALRPSWVPRLLVARLSMALGILLPPTSHRTQRICAIEMYPIPTCHARPEEVCVTLTRLTREAEEMDVPLFSEKALFHPPAPEAKRRLLPQVSERGMGFSAQFRRTMRSRVQSVYLTAMGLCTMFQLQRC